MNRRTATQAFAAASSLIASAALAAASMPPHVRYGGIVKSLNGRNETLHSMDLEFRGGQVSGIHRFGSTIGLSSQGDVTGTVRNGICTIIFGEMTYRGACNASRFSGQELRGEEVLGTFVFQKGAAVAEAAPSPPPARRAPAPVQSAPTARPLRADIPPTFRMELPTGDFDYVQGDDVAAGASGASASGNGPPGLPAPSGTRWAYGRDRWVIQPGGGCGRAELVRGYCFNAVIGYLQSRPKQKDVTVITLSRPTPLGTYISNDTPVRYQFVQVKRDGEWFRADRDLRGTSKVPIPPGCDFSPVREGFVLTGPGPRGLQEVALFRCP